MTADQIKLTESRSSEMATQPTPQLVRLSEVAASLGVPAMKIENMAGKRAAEWFDGSLAVTLDDAKKIFAAVRAEQAELDAAYVKGLDRDRQAVAEMEEAARRRAAAKPQSRVIRGVETFGPGDPEPSWMGDDE
jgi:hypothetical protein